MAKKKKEETAAETKKSVDASSFDNFDEYMQEKYGANILVDASFIVEKPTQILSVSPAVDIGIFGGIPEGTWFILSGNPKCGKTTLALHFAAKAQKAGKRIFYANVEARLSAKNILSAHGLDPSKTKVIQSEEGKILSGEEYLEICFDVLKHNPGCVLIIDSTSALCSANEFDSNIEDQQRPGMPKALAKFCRKMTQIVPIQKSVVVLIQHLMTSQGPGVAYKLEDGGQKVQYQNDTKLRCKGVEKWMAGDRQIGQIVTWDVAWCALGSPHSSITNYLRYGKGVDEITELTMLATDLGLITKGGAWYTCDFLGDGKAAPKFQGQENLYNAFEQNPDMFAKLEQAVKEML